MIDRAKKAQTTIEYLILLSMVATVVFLSLSPRILGGKGGLVNQVSQASNEYFNKVINGIMGGKPTL